MLPVDVYVVADYVNGEEASLCCDGADDDPAAVWISIDNRHIQRVNSDSQRNGGGSRMRQHRHITNTREQVVCTTHNMHIQQAAGMENNNNNTERAHKQTRILSHHQHNACTVHTSIECESLSTSRCTATCIATALLSRGVTPHHIVDTRRRLAQPHMA